MSEEQAVATPRPRFDPPQLWDDAAFRKRLAQLARKKGVSMKAAMQEIGLTVEFAYRSAESRSANLIMVVAEYFKVSPAELAGWVPSSDAALKTGAKLVSKVDEQLTSKLAELFSQQTLKMLLITLAMSQPDRDVGALGQLATQLAALVKEDWQTMGEKPIPNGG
jgi:hypothetical protein